MRPEICRYLHGESGENTKIYMAWKWFKVHCLIPKRGAHIPAQCCMLMFILLSHTV